MKLLLVVLLADIEMPGTNGIEVCRRLWQNSENPVMIFLSSKESLVFDTFEVQPFRFIRKSFFDASLPRLVQDIQKHLESVGVQQVRITESGKSIHL